MTNFKTYCQGFVLAQWLMCLHATQWFCVNKCLQCEKGPYSTTITSQGMGKGPLFLTVYIMAKLCIKIAAYLLSHGMLSFVISPHRDNDIWTRFEV